MPSSFGNTLRVSIFGQSHSPAIGCTIEGLPSGFHVDQDKLQAFMARRAPGQGRWSTPRKEADLPRIVSGLNSKGDTCGAPLAAIIENTNTRSGDYANVMSVPRPGHADFTAQQKWRGNQDVPGGGHFSGRLTAPLCIAGGIALQMLEAHGIHVAAHICQIGNSADERFAALDNSQEAQRTLAAQIESLKGARFPTLNSTSCEAMLQEIERARKSLDSVGGSIECVACGMPQGVGSPMFDGIESLLARALFGIPAVKGVEFGRGMDVASLHGSENNDPYRMQGGTAVPTTNNAGGALGGITTGAPILVRVAFKPTPSISRPQKSIDMTRGENADLEVRGRHDPCVVVRAVPVVEATCACALLDALLTYPAEA